jgi:hypothetical protein
MGILQQGATSIKNVDDARSKVESAIVAQVGLVADLYDASGGTAVFLADTNALYHNQTWTPGASRKRLVLCSSYRRPP